MDLTAARAVRTSAAPTAGHAATATHASTRPGHRSDGTPTAAATDSVAVAVVPIENTVGHRRTS
ncbi:hypothetical protein BIV25_00695 [Streptomyces sp. MUSC 14]|nr:hypothetical protein BIV25_00695 [Streptomyces sp. MUSC 14]